MNVDVMDRCQCPSLTPQKNTEKKRHPLPQFWNTIIKPQATVKKYCAQFLAARNKTMCHWGVIDEQL